MARLAVIIVSYNTRDLLAACLESVARELGDGSLSLLPTPYSLAASVLVVDNISRDGSAAMVAERFPWVRLLTPGVNLGFAAGNNLALRALGFTPRADEAPRSAAVFDSLTRLGGQDDPPDHVLLLNPDTVVQPGALSTLVQFLQTHPAAGVAGARLSYPDGQLQHSAFRFPGLAQTALDLFPPAGRLARVMETPLNGRYPRALYFGQTPFEVETLLGACLMARRDAIEAAGLLDEGFFMYAEELDWCRRFQQAGWRLYCVPTAHITHFEGQSTRQFRAAMFVELWRSRLRLFDKHYGPVYRAALRGLVWLGMTWGRWRTVGPQGEAYSQIVTLVGGPLIPVLNHQEHARHKDTKGKNK
ncbi:MAG: glycosyltransferase family 2 protein [Anaerolineae bacterium]|nr:glycosyltransferase family 2 protein [Anaerolineae bacterium]